MNLWKTHALWRPAIGAATTHAGAPGERRSSCHRLRWSGVARILLFLAAASPAAWAAGQSVSLINTSGSRTLPNTSDWSTLVSPGSYWIDFRVTSWSPHSTTGCEYVVSWPGKGFSSPSLTICTGLGPPIPFSVNTGSDVVGNPVYNGPPHIAIASASNTNPMVLTLATPPFPITMSVNSTITVLSAAGAGCSGMNANQTITAISGNAITIAYDGTGCAYNANSGVAYSQDFVYRYHRDLKLMQAIGESWNPDGTGYSIQSWPIQSAPPVTLPNPIQFGPAHVSMAYFRWYAGTIPVDAAPPNGITAGDGANVLADWEFDGSTTDFGPNRLTLSFSPSQTYQATPVYPPACSPGQQQTWRAGSVVTLDGSHSFPLDGSNQLSYLWQQTPSNAAGTPLQRVRWSSHNIANPVISRLLAGPLNFTLTVTDQSGLSSSCTVHDGAVATDDAGNVAVGDSRIGSIIGPLTQWNTSPWPFLDSTEKQWADLLGSYQGQTTPGKRIQDWRDQWNTPQQGTVTITYGDLRIYGTGTSFMSTFCGGGHFQVSSGQYDIVIWYPQAGMIGGSGRRLKNVGKCISDTVIDMSYEYSDDDGTSATTYNLDAPPAFSYTSGQTLIWRPSVSCNGGPTTLNVNGFGPRPLKKADGVTDPAPADCARSTLTQNGVNLTYNGSVFTIQGVFAPGSYPTWRTLPGTTAGMQYAAWGNWTDWESVTDNLNYYDSVLAFYTLYFRTGIDTYLAYARWLADRWWTMPYWDQGYSTDGDPGIPMVPRNQAFTGLILRALDQDDTTGIPGSSPMWPGLRHVIDNGHRYYMDNMNTKNMVISDIRELGYNDMAVALCAAYDPDPVHAAVCRADLNNSILITWEGQRQTDGSWQSQIASYASASGYFATPTGVVSTVAVTPGSNIVTISGASWNSSWFPARFFTVGNMVDATTRDQSYYNATYLDATHIQLDRNYADVCAPTCSARQWMLTPISASLPWIGFGTQPFQLGIVGQFMNQAYIALSLEPQYVGTAARVKGYISGIVNWLTTAGYAPYARGLWYGVGFGVCVGSNPDPSCYSGGSAVQPSVIQARELSPEVLGTLALGYLYEPSAENLAAIDNLFSAVYAKYASDPDYDGTYAVDIDPNGGLFYSRSDPKWQGFFWGMGRNAAWPSARQGGLAPAQLSTVYISGDMGGTHAAHIKVTVTDPTGAVRGVTICDASPCALQVNRTLGNAIADITYLSASGGVIGHDSEPLLLEMK